MALYTTVSSVFNRSYNNSVFFIENQAFNSGEKGFGRHFVDAW